MNFKAVYIIVLFIGLLGIFASPAYSGSDEAAHFDYINYLIENHTLPTTRVLINSTQLLSVQQYIPVQGVPEHNQHEAFHPPLYYIICSFAGILLSIISNNLLIRLYLLRAIGVFLLLVSVYFLDKIYRLLIEKQVLKDEPLLFTSVCMIFLLSPNFLSIMVPLNNEHLVVAITSALIYCFVRLVCSGNSSPDIRQTICISLLVSSMILSKLTTAYYSLIAGLILLMKNNYRHFMIFGLILLIATSPWFLFNIVTYGELTAEKEHIEIVQPIVNPGNVIYGPLYIISEFPIFISNIWFGYVNKSIPLLSEFLSAMMILSIALPLLMLSRSLLDDWKNSGIRAGCKNSARNNKSWLPILFVLPVLLNMAFLIYVSMSTPIMSLKGRYMFMNLTNFIFLMYYFLTNITNKDYKDILSSLFLIIAIAIIAIDISGSISEIF